MQHTSHDVSSPAQPGSDVTALQARIAELEQKLAAHTEHVQRQAFYASLLDHVNDAVIAVDADLQVLSWNRAAEQIYGWSAHEAVGRPLPAVIGETEYLNGMSYEAARQLLYETGCWSDEVIHRHRSGKRMYIAASVRMVTEGGNVVMVAVNREITARKQAEAALSASETRYREMFEGNQAIKLLIDPDSGLIMDANTAACAFYGYGRAALLTKRITEINLLPAEQINAALDQVARRHTSHFQFQHRLASGQVRDVEVHSSPIEINGRVLLYSVIHDMTERTRAELALRASETRLRLLIEQMPAVLWTTDRDSRLTSLVGTELDNLQLDPRAGLGQTLAEVFQADDPDSAPMEPQRRVLAGTSVSYEISWRGHALQCHVEPFVDTTGAIIGSIGVGFDVTERVRTLRLQAGQRRFFESLAAGTPLPNLLDDLLRVTVEQFEAAQGTIALIAELSVQPVGARLPPELTQSMLDRAAQSARGGAQKATAYAPLIQPDVLAEPEWAAQIGQPWPSNARALWIMPFGTQAGQLLGVLILCFSVPRSPTESELQQLIAAAHLAAIAVERTRTEGDLREREELFRLITEHVSDFVALLEQDGTFSYANPAFNDLMGYRPAALHGRRAIDFVHPDDAAQVEAGWRRLFTSTSAHTTCRLRHADGSWRDVELNGALIKRSDRRQIVITGRDITARRRAEAEQRRLEMQLLQAQKMETLGTLTGGIAHDFNNVLSVILGNAQLGLLQSSSTAAEWPLLTEIEQAASRGAALTRQLLAFSRRQTLARESVDLNVSIRELMTMVKRVISTEVEIQVDLTPDNVTILGDPAQIEQVMLNLVINARDAMPQGGRLEIGTCRRVIDRAAAGLYAWAAPGHYVQLTVSDTGIGMDAETQARVFEPFFTTKAQGKGTGLGLAVVYGIVQQHEGFIHVASVPGQGTTFTILLPTQPPQPAGRAVDRPAVVAGGTETVLVVDDEAALRRLTQTALEKQGYTVLLAEDGLAAIERFRADPARVDLVILDLVMPRCSGRDALRQIRALRPDVPALFVTGYDNSAELLIEDEGDTPPIIHKPYQLDVLSRTVRQLLDARR